VRAALAEIDLAAVRSNLARARELAQRHTAAPKLLAIVKADGYGHGLEAVAGAISTLGTQGADAFGVASLDDAVRLRAAGIQTRIVLLSGFDEPQDLAVIQALNVECVLHHVCQIELLEAEISREFSAAKPLRVWLKIDTGMRRLGFYPAQLPEVMRRLRLLPSVAPQIVLMTHFARADEITLLEAAAPGAGDAATLAQLTQFEQAAACQDFDTHTLANSGALLGLPALQQTHAKPQSLWLRPGGILYGLSTHDTLTGADLGFRPAMRLRTRLVSVKAIAAGDAVGYGGSFVADKAMVIGIAAIGYGDGYPRHAPSGTPVLVSGLASRTLGRVSMDLLTLDLTGLLDIHVGADVVLWGPELPVETIARCAETISYELTCGVTKRVQFRYGSP
jgi:alanine racemase